MYGLLFYGFIMQDKDLLFLLWLKNYILNINPWEIFLLYFFSSKR